MEREASGASAEGMGKKAVNSPANTAWSTPGLREPIASSLL